MSETIVIAFGAVEPIVRRFRAEITRGTIGADGWIGTMKQIEAVLDDAPLTVYERTVVRCAMISLINEQYARLNKPEPIVGYGSQTK